MKKLFYSVADILLKSKTFRKLVKILNWERTTYEAVLMSEKVSPDKKVLAGPFKGMVYPELKSKGSWLLPKIVGSYEDELHETIENIIKSDYKTILDIGCAEGYYAVGLALRLPEAKVYAFDIDDSAIRLCEGMAKANRVSERVIMSGFCDSNVLREFKYTYPALIVCDCEGFEQNVFVESNVEALKQVDILIELHDLVNSSIPGYIKELFGKTHEIKAIWSTGKHVVNYPQLVKDFDWSQYDDLVLYERGSLSEWVFLEAKNKIK
jgi:hypothetical protein